MKKNKLLKTLLLLTVMLVGSATNLWAYEGASGDVSLIKVNSKGKAVKLTDGCYAYRGPEGTTYNWSDSKGIKTQDNSGGFVIFYLSNTTNVTIDILHSESKNAHTVTANVYSLKEADYSAFYNITTEAAVDFTIPTETSKTLEIGIAAESKTFSNTIELAAGYYAVLCVGEKGNTYFNAIHFKAAISTTAPTITTQPKGASYLTGETISPLTVEATASAGNLSYQWFACDDAEKTNAEPIAATNASFTPTEAGFYFCRVTDGNGSTDSDVVEIQISAAAVPTISIAASATTVAKGAVVTLTATVEGNPTPTIQWYSNTSAINEGGTAIEGATSETYSPATTTPGTFYYYAVATNSQGNATSDVLTITVTASNKCDLYQVVYSNSFDAFIKESDATIKAYYMQGESVPTITSATVSEGATYAIVGNILTVTAEDRTTTKDYTITVSEVTPYTKIGELTFDGDEDSWIKTGYTYDTTKGWRFAKNDNSDNRIPEGRTRIYFFVGNAQSVTLTNGGVTSDRAIKVYVNGVEEKSITTIEKSSSSNNSITIPCNSDSYNMIAIVSNQTGGDGGFTKISLNAPVSVSATIANSGYTTFCSPYDLSFENVEGLEAAYVVTTSTTSTATLKKVTAVPGGTGVILKGTSGAVVTIPVAEYTGEAISNILVGTLNATPVTAETVYVVSDGVFKLFAGTEIPANKAYLPASVIGSNAPSLSFDFGGETTGLSEELRVNSKESIYYDLSGRRVAQPTKGLYIVNGKKVLVP